MSYAKIFTASLLFACAVAFAMRFSTSAKPVPPATTRSSDDQAIIDRAKAYLKLCGHGQEFERFSVLDPQSVEGLNASQLMPTYIVDAFGSRDNRSVSVTIWKRSLSLVGIGDGSDIPEQSVLATDQPYAFATEQEARDLALSYARKLFPEWDLRAETREFWIGDRGGVRARGAARFSVFRRFGEYDFLRWAASISVNTRDGSCSSVILTPLQSTTAPPVVRFTEDEAFRATGSKVAAHTVKLGWWAWGEAETARLTYHFVVGGTTHSEGDLSHDYYVDAETGKLVKDVF